MQSIDLDELHTQGLAQDSLAACSGGSVGEKGCELLLATSPHDLEKFGERYRVTFRANEPGVLDLSRLIVSGSREGDGEISPSPVLIDPEATITELEIFNSEQRIRGLGEVRAPAGVFSPIRRRSSITFGQIELQTGDTVALQIVSGGAESRGVVGVAAPFQPARNPNSVCPHLTAGGPHQMLASSSIEVKTHQPFRLLLTLEEDGCVDLGSLQLAGMGHAAPGTTAADVLASTVLESIRLPSGEDLIVGNFDGYGGFAAAPLAVPALMFSHFERAVDWIHFGFLEGLRGQQISLTLRRWIVDPSTPTATFSSGLRFYPSHNPGTASTRIERSDLLGDDSFSRCEFDSDRNDSSR